MLRVGRRRTKHQHLPLGVRPIGNRLYWQPPTGRKGAAVKSVALGVIVLVRGRIEMTKAQRVKWAEVSGHRDGPDTPGLVYELTALWADGDGILKRPNGERRADETVTMYRKDLAAINETFGPMRYGRTAEDASKGEAIGTVDVQNWIAESPTPGLVNRRYSVLDNVFQYAIIKGRTTYNPCADAVKNARHAREREPLSWEVECLRTLAGPLLGLQMDFEAITGWRISEIQRLQRTQLTPDGIRVRKRKKGKRQLWEWTPELRRIIDAAAVLAGATPFPASPVFPSRRGRPQSYGAFDSSWQALKRKANALLHACEVPLKIEDLHFHDLRSKAHDDAEEAGHEGHQFLGNSPGVARKHYQRREQKVRPLR